MSKARIALSFVPAVILVGCHSEPEPVAQVPPPNYAAQPEPLPPVTVIESPDDSAYEYREESAASRFEPEPLPPVMPTRTYTVRKGDTLWAIASRTYGDGQKWVDIAQANPSLDPKKLAIGQQIILP